MYTVIIPIYDDKLDENTSKDLIWLNEPFRNIKNLKWILMRKTKNYHPCTGANDNLNHITNLANLYLDNEQQLYVLCVKLCIVDLKFFFMHHCIHCLQYSIEN